MTRNSIFRGALVERALFLISAVYFAALSIYLSNRRMMWPDEFDGWYLLTDPSWRHMMQSWRRGADGGGHLFYVIGHSILTITGNHPLTMRLFSAFCLWSAAVIWWKILQACFSKFAATASVLLVWLCTSIFVYHLAEARFYGLLILLFTLLFSSVLWLESRDHSTSAIFAVFFAANGLLVTTHMLSVIYSAVILMVLIFARAQLRSRLAAIAAICVSFILIIPNISALKNAEVNSGWIHMPDVSGTLRYYFHNPTPQRFFNLACYLLIAAGIIHFLRYFRQLSDHGTRRTILLAAVALIAAPGGFYILSHLYKPLFVDRYLMPYFLGFASLFALGWWTFEHYPFFHRRHGWVIAFRGTLLVGIAFLHISCLRQQWIRPIRNIQPLLDLHSTLPMVITSDMVFFQMRYYGGASGANVFYLLPTASKGYTELGEMAVMARQGYNPGIVDAPAFLATHQSFLYPDFPESRVFYQIAVSTDPHWVAQDIGVVTIYDAPVHILRISYVPG